MIAGGTIGACLALLSSNAFASPGEYQDELVAVAHARKLAADPQWIALGHYEESIFFGRRGTADDRTFFTAENGKNDPEAELDSTIRAFFAESGENPNEHPQCRFPARYRWLKSKLQFDPARLEEQNCPAFNEWRDGLRAAGVSLVYPAAHLNNPASSFGHTFLRIDAEGQDDRTRLLAYSANYAALTTETQGLLYAFRGIFGLYQGGFTIDPYYMQVRRYSDMESRDIWEYRLSLTKPEVERLVEHLWELGPTRFDYYFFDENCSYQLLTLIQAARPGLKLDEKFRLWAIPVDTIRAVINQDNVLAGAEFRPSLGTILKYRTTLTEEPVWRAAEALSAAPTEADQILAPLPLEEHAAALELAADYLNYEMMKKGDAAVPEQRKLYQLVKLRSELNAPRRLPMPKRPEIRPDQGHDTARLETASGMRDGDAFYGLSYRPAYHDLLDPQLGFEKGAAIDFFKLSFRQYEGEGLRLEEFTPLSITSIAPRDYFIAPISWRFSSGLLRTELEEREANVFRNSVGAGLGAELGSRGLAYLFLNGVHEQSQGYASEYAVGAGPSAGVLWDLTDALRLSFSGEDTFFGIGAEHRREKGEAALRYTFSRDSAARLSLRANKDYDNNTFETELSWLVYF